MDDVAKHAIRQMGRDVLSGLKVLGMAALFAGVIVATFPYSLWVVTVLGLLAAAGMIGQMMRYGKK